MELTFQDKHYLTTIAASFLAGFFVFSFLSNLFVSAVIVIPVAVGMSILVFGLTEYYNKLSIDSKTQFIRSKVTDFQHDTNYRNYNGDNHISSLLFMLTFAILILLSFFAYEQDSQLFVDWNRINAVGIVQLAVGVLLCFFIPGYGIVLIFARKFEANRILVLLFSYLLSMLITGLTAYIPSVYFGVPISESKYLFLIVYLGIILSFLISHFSKHRTLLVDLKVKQTRMYEFRTSKVIKDIKSHCSEIVIFGSLFTFVLVATYGLHGGTTFNDQWYHQGRSLLFLSGSLREAVITDAEGLYPPFQSALLAALTTLSGIPLVNSYASIAFLNCLPLLAFYCLFLKWTPAKLHKSVLLACSLFVLSSGFGWVFSLNVVLNESVTSPQSSLDTLRNVGFLDMISPSNFVIAKPPDFSTGLIYIALPAGFILLTLVNTKIQSKVVNIFSITAISVLGIISHYEFFIFIMVASISPILFNMKAKNYVYLSMNLAMSVVFLMDIFAPGNFYTYLEILGIPLLFLALSFILISWAIYLIKGKLALLKTGIGAFFNLLQRTVCSDTRFKRIPRVVIVLLAVYLYVMSFIVLDQLPLNEVRNHAVASTVPWYLYTLRLGIVGVLGIASILSYLFKKYEKQVFIFGIIILIAFVAGPYYLESRFVKYMMVGLVAFTTILLFKFLNHRYKYRPIVNPVLLGVILPISGLSTLIFIGYNSLIFQTEDYIDTLPRMHFPSTSEIKMFEKLHDMVKVDPNKQNIVSFSGEYSYRKDGLMSKLPFFVGLPYLKARQSPLTLNSSAIDTLYRQLESSDVHYIAIPKHSIQMENSIAEPARFAIDYFRHIYEDSDNIILEVPSFRAPSESPKTEIGIAYNQADRLPLINSSKVMSLLNDNKIFDINNSMSPQINIDNKTKGIVLNSEQSGPLSLWSSVLTQDNSLHYVEARFTIESDQKTNSYVGLKWQEGNTEYYVRLSNDGIKLHEKIIGDAKYRLLTKNDQIQMKQGIQYSLKIESFNGLIKIYLNSLPKLQIIKASSGHVDDGISRIGLVSYETKVEFNPVTIGNFTQKDLLQYENTKYYNYYYPFNIAALSNSSFDIFSANDLAVFTKKIILVSDTLKIDEFTMYRYLEFLEDGGKLIVINSDNNFNGTFSRLFSLRSDESESVPFTSINGVNPNISLKVPGLTKQLKVNTSADTSTLAWYRSSEGMSTAPFAIRKSFSDTTGGEIIMINAQGYFNAVSSSPEQYFQSLSSILKILEVDSQNDLPAEDKSFPINSFLGNMQLNGKIELNSSSLTFPDRDFEILNASRIDVIDKTGVLQYSYHNTIINGLKISGKADVQLSIIDRLQLPDFLSDGNYIAISIPNSFNMTVRLYPEKNTSIHIDSKNQSSVNFGGSTIHFYNIVPAQLEGVTVILKSPQILIDGNATIENPIFGQYLADDGRIASGPPFNLQGKLNAELGFVESYNQRYPRQFNFQYITYLNSISTDGKIQEKEGSLKIPGDISTYAKIKGGNTDLVQIILSKFSIVTLLTASVITVFGVWLVERYYTKTTSEPELV